MSQGTPNWPPLQQSGVPVGYDAANEHSMLVWAQDLAAVPPGQPASLHGILPPYPLYLSDPGEFPYTMEDQDMGLDPSCLLSEGLADIRSAEVADQLFLSFNGHEHSQLGNSQDLLPLQIPTDGAAGPSSSSTVTDPSPRTPLEPYVVGHFPSQESPGIKLPDITDQFLLPFDEDSQSDDVLQIPANVAAFLPPFWNTNDLSSQSPVKPSASRPSVIEIKGVEDYLKAVGSKQIQQAADKRRKKDGIHECPFRNAPNSRCKSTFTARHNLRYHVYSHVGYKPYKCETCKYAASSPATLKRHQSTCKGTS